MSLENEDRLTVDQQAETNCELKQRFKFSYARDFLLSLKELDACKKLPIGFDQSILSEFEDTSQDRQKNSSGFSLHGYRRNEYGSSPPTKGESGNYSRGIHGRWDSQSSGRTDKDSDSQSDLDSDSGRRYGNQSRRPWQVPEHDGLLGSGSFARPSGYAVGASAPKFRANDHYQLNKSNEPYHPPRPYKAAPHSRRETSDSFNDETFGSSDCTSEDRAEEERKRRASFELMRKEQQKEFQEKHKLNSEKRKDEFDISTLRDESKDEGISSRSQQVHEPVLLPATVKHSDKSVLPAQAPSSRPLVPPGFANAALERNHGTTSISHSHSLEVGNSEIEGGILPTKGVYLLNGTFDELDQESAEPYGLKLKLDNTNICVLANNKSDKLKNLTSYPEFSNKIIGHDQKYEKNSNMLTAFEESDKSEVVDLGAEKVVDNKSGEDKKDQSSSILDNLFSGAVTVDSVGSKTVQQHEIVLDDTCSPHAVQSSKFACWFLEEEKKPVDISCSRPKDLLSLIVGGEKRGFQTSDVKAAGKVSSGFPSLSSELVDRHLASNVALAAVENTNQLCDVNINKALAVPAILTCEDLELSILSEITASDETSRPPLLPSSVSGAKTKENGDEHASQHLLSLLHKGVGLKDAVPSTGLGFFSSDKPHNVEVTSIQTGVNDLISVNPNVTDSGKNPTLEALFGTAFMKELQSVGAPSSTPVGSAKIDDSDFHDGLLSSKMDISSCRTSYGSCSLPSNQIEQIKSDRVKEDNFKKSLDSQCIEEDSLIRLGDPMKHLRNPSKTELVSSAAPVDDSEKLPALSSTFRNGRPIIEGEDGSPFHRGPYDVREHDVLFQSVHALPSSQQLHPQLNHVNSQMTFMATENVTHHDPPAGHQFPVYMHRPPLLHSSMRLTGVDAPTHHRHTLQQMPRPGSFPPPHLLRGFPSSPHSSNQVAGFIQDANPLQSFPFGNGPPNFMGLGAPRMPPPVLEREGRTNTPETLQRLIEMELRSNPRQIHRLATAGPDQGMYNHELDMGFRYRL